MRLRTITKTILVCALVALGWREILARNLPNPEPTFSIKFSGGATNGEIVGGNSFQASVESSVDAPGTGYNVQLSVGGPNYAAVAPGSVMILAGQHSASFTIVTQAPSQAQAVSIQARLGSSLVAQKQLTVLPPIAPLQFTQSPGSPLKLPYSKAHQFTFSTSGGAGYISFAYSVTGADSSLFRIPSAGAPVASSTVGTAQSPSTTTIEATVASSTPAQPATKMIEFVGAPGFTPPSGQTLLSVTATDSANHTATKIITINFTRANGKPIIVSVAQLGGPFEGKFAVAVEPGTFSLNDEGALYFAIYANNFKYEGRNATGSNTFTITFDDINKGRTIQVVLKNTYGESNAVSVTYMKYPSEPIPTYALSPATANGRDYALFNHEGVIPASGIDEFRFSSLSSSYQIGDPGVSSLGCNQTGTVYVGSALIVFEQTFGTARLESEPPKGQLLQPDQKIRAHWEHGVGNVHYQIIPSFRGVVGVCSNRVL